MADFSLLLQHPDREEIISKLVTGSSPKEVYQWLKLKYPGDAQNHLRLKLKTLKEFAESPLLTDYYGKFKQDLSQVTSGQVNRGLSDSIINNKTYQERLKEIAGKELDWTKMVENLIAVCFQRVEQVFDTMQQDPSKFKGDNYLLRYLADITSAVERLKKISLIENDTQYKQAVSMQVLDNYKNALQETIKDLLAEIDPDTAFLFLDKLHDRLGNLEPPTEPSQEERLEEVKMLEAKIIDSEDD